MEVSRKKTYACRVKLSPAEEMAALGEKQGKRKGDMRAEGYGKGKSKPE
jgi:hypothetical protein